MQKLVYLILIMFVGAMGTACKDVCEKAADVAEGECDLDVSDEDAEAVECTGDTEAGAQCVIDNSAAFCEYLDELAAGDFTFTNAYTDCVGEI